MIETNNFAIYNINYNFIHYCIQNTILYINPSEFFTILLYFL